MTLPAAIAVTFFADHAATRKCERMLSCDVLAEMIRSTTAPAKDRLPWLKLARFGNAKSAKGSLRHDRNLIAITGIEADYDAEKVSFDEAVDIAEKAGLLALIYTSPSYTLPRPRWRVLCPTSQEFPPGDRPRLLGRLNGLYRGVFARESWTLSQSYYFGSISRPAVTHRVEIVDGIPIDQLDELDSIALGPPATTARGGVVSDGREARVDAELIRSVVTGEGYHVELCALAARYVGRGFETRAIVEVLQGIMLALPDSARDQRWHDRFASIPGIVTSAQQKFAPEADRRRAIARLTHRLVRQRRPGEEIRAALVAEAERTGISPQSAVAIGEAILREQIEGRHRARR